MRSFGLTDATGNTYGFPRVVVYGPDGKIKFPSGGGGGSGTVTSIGITVPSGFSVTPATITTSGTFAITGAGTVSDYIDGTGALQPFPTINTYTVNNGLTENPPNNFQLGGPLVGDTIIDGASNVHSLAIQDLYAFDLVAEQKAIFTANDGTNTAALSLYPQSNNTVWSYDDGTNLTEMEMTGAKMFIRTPDYATAANGDVLTLINNTTGEVEFQPSTGGLPYGIASGTNNYTVTIAGVTGYTDGDAYIIKFTNGNDADSDIDINGLGVKTLVKEFNVQITGGDIVSGQDLIIIYDGTNFQTLGVAPNQLFAYVTNDDTVAITKGQPVYAAGAAGNRMSVKLAYNTTDATSAQTVGVVFSTSIAPNQRGFVICQGVISGVNTAAYSPGNQLYLGATAGSLTATKPFAPNHLVYVGIVERANAGNGQIYIKPQNGYEMNELHDVQSNGAVNNDVLYRDTTVSPNLWKPASITTILGYTPVPDSRILTINGTSYDLTADRSWTIAAGGSSATIGTTIDGSGGTITVGQKGYVQVPYGCTINSWRIIANASGSIVIDIWKAASPTIPTVANTITGSALPTLSSQQTNASSTLTGWTTSVAANDIIGFNVNSATTVTWVILQIFVTKT